MRHRVPRLVACCWLVFLLLATVQPVRASDEPTVATPRTFHRTSQISITLGGSTVTGTGEADYDLEKTALHTLAIVKSEGVEVRVEIYLVAGKLYLYNARQQRWEYIAVPPADLDTLLPILRVPAHPTASYAQAGAETIEGAQTTKWRASNVYNALVLSATRSKLTGTLVEETLTAEAFIGATNNYLYRLVMQEQGVATSYGAANDLDLDGPVASLTTTDYSKFNQPLTITPPANAVPAQGATPPRSIEPTTALQLKAMIEYGVTANPATMASLLLTIDLPASALP